MPMQSLRIGVIGLGNMGAAHIKNHIPQVEGLTLTAVADADESGPGGLNARDVLVGDEERSLR